MLRETALRIGVLTMQRGAAAHGTTKSRRRFCDDAARKPVIRRCEMRFRNILQHNALRTSLDDHRMRAKRLSPPDAAARIQTASASRAPTRIDARSCKIIAASRRDRRCFGDHLGEKQLAPHPCVNDARRTTATQRGVVHRADVRRVRARAKCDGRRATTRA